MYLFQRLTTHSFPNSIRIKCLRLGQKVILAQLLSTVDAYFTRTFVVADPFVVPDTMIGLFLNLSTLESLAAPNAHHQHHLSAILIKRSPVLPHTHIVTANCQSSVHFPSFLTLWPYKLDHTPAVLHLVQLLNGTAKLNFSQCYHCYKDN